MCTHNQCFEKNEKNIIFHLKIEIFTAVKYCCILHGRVCVMLAFLYLQRIKLATTCIISSMLMCAAVYFLNAWSNCILGLLQTSFSCFKYILDSIVQHFPRSDS